MATTLTLPNGKDENSALKAELARLQAENDKMKADAAAKAAGMLTLKVSEKGAVSLIGLQRFPVTLYKGQWLKVADIMPSILKFIEVNNSKLSQGKAAS